MRVSALTLSFCVLGWGSLSRALYLRQALIKGYLPLRQIGELDTDDPELRAAFEELNCIELKVSPNDKENFEMFLNCSSAAMQCPYALCNFM